MIYIDFEEGQGLGNQLFLYVAAYSLSKKHNTKVACINYTNFKGKEFLALDILILESISPKYKYYEKKVFDLVEKTYLYSYDKNFEEIDDETLIVGIFQDLAYQNYLTQNDLQSSIISINHKPVTNGETCCINIRGGEYKTVNSLLLNKLYWINAKRLFCRIYGSKIPIKIVTDDEEYAKSIFPDNEIVTGVENSFNELLSANYYILSNSSFPIIPILLNSKNVEDIFAPAGWSRPNGNSKFWYSPCNVYKGWKYLDTDGNIIDPVIVEKRKRHTEKYFFNNVLVVSENQINGFLLKAYMKTIKLISHLFKD